MHRLEAEGEEARAVEQVFQGEGTIAPRMQERLNQPGNEASVVHSLGVSGGTR